MVDPSNNTEPADPSFQFTSLEWPPTVMNIIGVIVLFFMTILSTAGGIGGAGINIPFMMIFFQLPIKETIPVANIFGLLSSLVRFIINFNQRHPNNP